jgi:hypothetical protein
MRVRSRLECGPAANSASTPLRAKSCEYVDLISCAASVVSLSLSLSLSFLLCVPHHRQTPRCVGLSVLALCAATVAAGVCPVPHVR